MSELDIRHDNTVATPAAAPQQQITTQSALVKWAEDARVVNAIAESIAKTPFAGALRGKPLEVTAVILAGNELGLKPMAALKSVDIIQGTPALRANAMRGLVQSHGHEIELVESDEQHCIMQGRRKGAENWQTVTWTIQRAGKLGLLGKNEWKKQPQTMLVARATGELCRLIASDVLHGMPYAAEELSGTTEVTVEQVRAAPLSVAQLTAAPTPASQPVAQPDVVDPAADDAEHAAAVAELRAFGAEMDAPDIEQDAYAALGMPLDDAPAQAIRDLVTRWRNDAA
ncbi:hypothetical protein ACIO6U_02980 [Streptomyces sp. NPDC087422]|uniref:hypothetical protein n=1 Tax=Streptomyces sp. NPDC087422 TaxID=3365786 RepID=UPI00381520E4